jgi:Protein of unknown function (DUF2961)
MFIRSLRTGAVRRLKRLAYVSFATTCFVLPACLLEAQSGGTDFGAARRYYLDPLIHLQNYSPGKNSFLIQNLHRGDKRTVLDVKSGGSVRHIWSTWSIPGDDSDIPAPGRVRMNIFVDGQSQPAISGALDDLCRAAERSGDRFVPLPAFNYKGAFNIYLPIFFDRGVRIEIEATDEIAEFYTQIDYRTGENVHHSPRLLSENSGANTTLKYVGGTPRWQATHLNKDDAVRHTAVVDYGSSDSGEFTVDGPGILRELSFRGDMLSALQLEIYWDDESSPSVQAPLRYFFADFTNAAMESKSGRSTTYFPMPFGKKARLAIRSLSGRSGRVHIEYRLESGPLAARTLYFHAQYHETPSATGYSQYSVFQAQGEGLFVGMNLFNSGHNHGGGDAALIDPGTAHPLVLHGICGEDYFGFAWHNTGTMTPLTGAPVHERRYRLHLENPYPFHQSIQFLFGVFAGQHPMSVAFWYQLPAPTSRTGWTTFNIPWKILGPVALDTSLPNAVTDASYATVISLNQPAKVEERWQDVEMRFGFIDSTYQFRHYTMIEKGTGFVACAGKTRIITYVYAPSQRKLDAIIGHDDSVTVSVNGPQAAELAAHSGFGPSRFSMGLRAGWNKLDLVIYNDENMNWRWSGISLSFDQKNSADLKFASQPPASKE